MNKKEMRLIAQQALRSHYRRTQNGEPTELTADEALAVLDDMFRVDYEAIATAWYHSATPNQIKLFKKEWRKWVSYWQNLAALDDMLEGDNVDWDAVINITDPEYLKAQQATPFGVKGCTCEVHQTLPPIDPAEEAYIHARHKIDTQ